MYSTFNKIIAMARTIAGEIQSRIGPTYNAAIHTYVDSLTDLGRDAIAYAYNKGHGRGSTLTHGPYRDGRWRHRTYNLHDSFGSAVFANGSVIPSSIRFVGGGELSKSPDKRTGKRGREKLLEYFNNAHYGAKKGEIVLVCMVAMYYGGYLEKGVHRGRYKIQVISAARDFIDKNWNKYVEKKGRTLVKKYARILKSETING